MLATSMKTATFLLTRSPCCPPRLRPQCRARGRWSMSGPWSPPCSSAATSSRDARKGGGAAEALVLGAETESLPPGPFGGIVGLGSLDGGAALVGGRPNGLLDEEIRDRVDVTLGIRDEEIDRADVAAGSDGRTDREDRAARDLPPLLRDEDAGMGQEDELAQDVSGVELAGHAVAHPVAAQCDEAVDIRDPSWPDPVLHEPVLAPCVGRRQPDARVVRRTARGRACDRSVTNPGGGRPVLQSVRRSLSYGIASAAT